MSIESNLQSTPSTSTSSPVPSPPNNISTHRYQHRQLTSSAYTPYPPPPPHQLYSTHTSDPSYAAPNGPTLVPPSLVGNPPSSGPQHHGYAYLPPPSSSTAPYTNHDPSSRPLGSSQSFPSISSAFPGSVLSETGGGSSRGGSGRTGVRAQANKSVNEGAVEFDENGETHRNERLEEETGAEEEEHGYAKVQVSGDAAQAVKTRRRTTRVQFTTLEQSFYRNSKPSSAERQALADELDMTPRSVQIWFQNRRAKAKNKAKKDALEDASPEALVEEDEVSDRSEQPFIPSVQQPNLPSASSLSQLSRNPKPAPHNSHPSHSSSSSVTSSYRRDSVQSFSDLESYPSSATSGFTNSPTTAFLRWDPQTLPPPPNTKSQNPIAPPGHSHPQYLPAVYRPAPAPQPKSTSSRQSSRRSSIVGSLSSSDDFASSSSAMERRSSGSGTAAFHPYSYNHYRGDSAASSTHSLSSAGGGSYATSSSRGSPAACVSAGMSRRGSVASLRSSGSGGGGPDRTGRRMGSNLGDGSPLGSAGGALMARRGSVPHPSPLQLSRSNFTQFQHNPPPSHHPPQHRQHPNEYSPQQYPYDQSHHYPHYPADRSLLPSAPLSKPYSQQRRSSVPASYHSEKFAPQLYSNDASPQYGYHPFAAPAAHSPDQFPSHSHMPPPSSYIPHSQHDRTHPGSYSIPSATTQRTNNPLSSSTGSSRHPSRGAGQRDLSPTMEDSAESSGMPAASFADYQFPSSTSSRNDLHPQQQHRQAQQHSTSTGPSFLALDAHAGIEDAERTATPFDLSNPPFPSSSFASFEQQQQHQHHLQPRQSSALVHESSSGPIRWNDSFGNGPVTDERSPAEGGSFNFPAYDGGVAESNDRDRQVPEEMVEGSGELGPPFGFDPNASRPSAPAELLRNFSSMQVQHLFPAGSGKNGGADGEPTSELYTLHESMDGAGGGLMQEDDSTHTTIFSPAPYLSSSVSHNNLAYDLSPSAITPGFPHSASGASVTYQPHDDGDDDEGEQSSSYPPIEHTSDPRHQQQHQQPRNLLYSFR